MKRSSSVPAAAPASGIPTRLGKYELLMPLAAGGMARIYIGRSTGIGAFERHVVLKLITPERANDQIAVQMFLDEARLAASLNHQNVAQVFEVGEDGGIHYLAMEYVHGQDLRALLAKAGSQGTRIPVELALTVVAGAAAGLNHAHERRGPDGTPLGIVHRDVSPSNIMIGYDGAVKLLDFGIAKATSRSVETQSGIIKGKFAYMAPEQCRGRDVDRRSDVFSLGIILYEISTQHRCFRADSDFDTMHRIVTGDVVRPTRLVPNYPQALEAIVMKALALEATQRYQSAGLLLEALEAFAVSTRMSLSTMGLGRFMRDMFGEIQEPWVTGPGSQPVIAKENTISSTDSHSDAAISRPLATTVALEVDDEEEDEEAAAKTILELPREDRAATDEPAQPAWNDRAYPAPGASEAPGASARSEPASAVAAASPSPEPRPRMLGALSGSGPATTMLGPAVAVEATMPPPQIPAPMPQASQPLIPQNAFARAPSSSASSPAEPALGSQPLPSTKHGYASGGGMTAGDLGYPRYTAPPEAAGDLNVTPNRKPLIIGIAVLAIGVALVLIAKLAGGGGGGSSTDQPSAVPPTGSDEPTGSAHAAGPASSEAIPAPSPPSVPDEMIGVHVQSQPVGADVLVAGTKIGTTPLDTKLHRGTAVTQLTVHLAGYVDVITKIDLAGDFSKDVELKTQAEVDAAAAPKGSAAPGRPDEPAKSEDAHKTVKAVEHHVPAATPAVEHKQPPKTPEHKQPAPKCQQPGPNMDPFSGIPVCRS